MILLSASLSGSPYALTITIPVSSVDGSSKSDSAVFASELILSPVELTGVSSVEPACVPSFTDILFSSESSIAISSVEKISSPDSSSIEISASSAFCGYSESV